MKKIKSTGQLFLLGIVIIFSSCDSGWFGVTGKGTIITETRNVGKFNKVELLGFADVEITKGTTQEVKVSNFENIIQYLYLEVKDSTLIIRNEPKNILLFNSEAKVQITMPDPLYSAVLTGSGNFNINSAFNNINSLKIIGSGNIDVPQVATYNHLEVSVSGSGDVTANGTTQSLVAKIVGSGNLKLGNLKAVDADCLISGSGNIYTNATGTLKAVISGAGNIEYTGKPVLNISITGSGNVYSK